MKKELLLAVAGIVLISGCTGVSNLLSNLGLGGTITKEEKVLSPKQGLGVTQFKTAVDNMVAGTYNYILMAVRNHAGGSNAKNIIVSLENVKPFLLHECGEDKDPVLPRTVLCNQFYDDYGVPYKAHKVNMMFPDEEVQFFWNIKAPSEGQIGKMQYEQRVYYTLSYDYSMVITKTIAGISQDEFLRQSEEGPVTISGKQTSSAGEIKLTSKTQEPFVYLEDGGDVSINLNFDINNQGEGILKSGTDMIIVVKKPDDTKVTYDSGKAEDYGWVKPSELIEENKTKYDELANTYPELKGGSGQYVKVIKSEDINSGVQTISLPVIFNSKDFYEPQKILTFTVYITYTYLKEGYTTIKVFPIK